MSAAQNKARTVFQLTPAHRRAVESWRAQALRIIADLDSTQTQVELAWRFLREWGARWRP